MREVAGLDMGQRAQRQPVAHRRIAGDQEQLAATGRPALAAPPAAVARLPALDRQHEARRNVEAAVEDAGQALALLHVLELVVGRIEVLREHVLLEHEVRRVLEGRQHMVSVDAQPLGQAVGEAPGLLQRGADRRALVGDERRIAPQWLAVGAPIEGEGPARQLLAGVPLALAVMEHAARREAHGQPLDQVVRPAALHRPDGGGVPFGTVAVVDRDEGRLAADGEAHVVVDQPAVDGAAGLDHLAPGLLVVGQGDARLLDDAAHAHLVAELDLAGLDQAGDGCRVLRVGGGGQRQVALAGQQARGRVEADPAGARQEHLGPGMQVGEVGLGTGGPVVERLHVGLELDQVARDEAGGEAEVAQDLHQQPGAVAAGSRGQLQRLLGRLDAGLEADGVAGVLPQALVQGDQEVDGGRGLARHAVQPSGQQRPHGCGFEERLQILPQQRLVDEGDLLGGRLEEEVEGVEHRHLGDEVDLDRQLAGGLGEDEAGEIVAVRILLPVDEVLCRQDFQRIGEDAGPAVRRGTEPDDLRPEMDRPVVAVGGLVVERHVHDHDGRVPPSASSTGPAACILGGVAGHGEHAYPQHRQGASLQTARQIVGPMYLPRKAYYWKRWR